MGYIDLAVESLPDLVGGSRFEEQLQRLFEVVSRFGYGVTLTGDIHLWTEGDVSISLALDNCRQLSVHVGFTSSISVLLVYNHRSFIDFFQQLLLDLFNPDLDLFGGR
jgi:hypothetical protein